MLAAKMPMSEYATSSQRVALLLEAYEMRSAMLYSRCVGNVESVITSLVIEVIASIHSASVCLSARHSKSWPTNATSLGAMSSCRVRGLSNHLLASNEPSSRVMTSSRNAKQTVASLYYANIELMAARNARVDERSNNTFLKLTRLGAELESSFVGDATCTRN
jgi:hypothetical protein